VRARLLKRNLGIPLKVVNRVRCYRPVAQTGFSASIPSLGRHADGCASSELIVLDVYRGMIADASYNRAIHHKSEPYAIVQTHRPVDGGFHGLPWQKGFAGGKKQPLAADIQAMADAHSVQNKSKSGTPALDCQA